MRIATNPCIFLLIGTALLAAEEKPSATPEKTPANDSLSQQLRAISQTEQSINTQRETIKKQAPPRAPGQGFFLSSPPARTLHPLGPGYASENASAPPCEPLPVEQVDALIAQAATREALDPTLLRGVMEQESAFRPCAVSSKGAMGLMQLMPATAAEFGVRDPFDPGQSVDAGARFLKQLLQNYGGDVSLALGAYNAGPGKVNEVGGIPPIPETVDYVRRVMMLLPALQ
jgi:transglycosylase-like protein with SLT domain